MSYLVFLGENLNKRVYIDESDYYHEEVCDIVAGCFDVVFTSFIGFVFFEDGL